MIIIEDTLEDIGDAFKDGGDDVAVLQSERIGDTAEMIRV